MGKRLDPNQERREMMSHFEAAQKYREAYLAGQSESARTRSDPKEAKCPYTSDTKEYRAFWMGWNYHYDPAWDLILLMTNTCDADGVIL